MDKFRLFIYTLLVVVCIGFTNCSDGYSELLQTSDFVLNENEGQIVNLTLSMGRRSQTRVGLVQKEGSKAMEGRFQEGDMFWICVKQGDLLEEIGMTPLKNVSEDGKRASLSLQLPNTISTGSEFSVYGVSAKELQGNKVSQGQMYYYSYLQCALLENYQVPICFEGKGADNQLQVDCNYIGSHVLVHLKNTSNDDTAFQFNGFGYGTFSHLIGNLELESDDYYMAYASDKEQPTESFNLPKGTEQIVAYGCLTTENTQGEIRINCIANNKNVTTANTLTVNKDFEQGRAYHITAIWDGYKLAFENGNTPPMMVSTNTVCIKEGESTSVRLYTEGNNMEDDLDIQYDDNIIRGLLWTTYAPSSKEFNLYGGRPGSTNIIFKNKKTGEQATINVIVRAKDNSDLTDELNLGYDYLEYDIQDIFGSGPIVDIPGIHVDGSNYSCESSNPSVINASYSDLFSKIVFSFYGPGISIITITDNQTGKKSKVIVALTGNLNKIVNLTKGSKEEETIALNGYDLEAYSESPLIATCSVSGGTGRLVTIKAQKVGNTRIQVYGKESYERYTIDVHVDGSIGSDEETPDIGL